MSDISTLNDQYLLVEFKGKPSQFDVIDITEKALKELSENKLSKTIVDTRELGVIFPLSLNWYRNVWYPNAMKSGLKVMAIVVPAAFLGDMKDTCLYNVHFRRVGIKIRFFVNFSQASLWLKQQ